MISTLTPAGSPTRNPLPAGSESPAGDGSRVPAGVNPAGYVDPAGYVNPPGQGQALFPVPARMPAAALELLRKARQELAEAQAETDTAIRYNGAHLAALRAAAAIVAARGEPGTGTRRRRVRPVWELLPQVEPTLAEWAAFFAAGAAKRAAAQAGLPRAATAREADDLLRDAAVFLGVAERALGLDGEPMLPPSLRHAS